MLQNSRVTALTVFELLRENQLGGGLKLPPPPPRLGLTGKGTITTGEGNVRAGQDF